MSGVNDANVQQPMVPPNGGVAVRMYRLNGLGDCFLLAFHADDGGRRYMLIDCGILFGTRGGAARMKAVASDIAALTDHHLDVLVVTHEHWDHVSGFSYARKIFDTIHVDEVWLAWTEDPTDALARRLKQRHAIALKALSTAAARLKDANELRGRSIERVLGFVGRVDAKLGTAGTANLLDYVRHKGARVCYRDPGEPPIAIPGVAGVQVYVLGPPRDEKLISRSKHSERDSEVYRKTLGLDLVTAIRRLDAAEMDEEALTAEQRLWLAQACPFDARYCTLIAQAKEQEFYRTHYEATPEGEDLQWRRIDLDWLAASEQLALDLDGDTNNTSLVLAIQLVQNQHVLLFAGDAQVGNWLSWQDVSWPGNAQRGVRKVTGRDLIKQTVLYKVCHHASHNATLRQRGLELMQSPELVAMIPVDADQAQQKKWAMPFDPLLERLQQKTHGRIIRADRGLPEKPASVDPSEWDRFLERIAADHELWIELVVT